MDKLRDFDIVDTDRQSMLLVEGVQDALFCEAMLEHLGLSDKVQIVEAKGRPNIADALENIAQLRAVRFKTLLKLGIIQDADQSAESSKSDVVKALQSAGLPVPAEGSASPITDSPIVSVFIAPDNRSQGGLEDLCVSSLSRAEVQCLDEHIERVSRCDLQIRSHLVSKVQVALHLATEPAFKKYDRSLSREVRDNLRPGIAVGLAAKYSIWDWSRPEFKPVKLFLSRLASV
jgi:hypothetical protein